MARHDCRKDTGHINAFIDLNGIPYLLAEYLDKRTFQQVDRSCIRSGIFVDQSEAMRAVIDINIDDIGKRGSDGLPAIRGNNTKQKDLLRMIAACRDQFDNRVPTLRRGLVLRVNYQLENKTSGSVVRTMAEDFKIMDRQYYLDINPRDVDDNAIVVNLAGTYVSTVGEYSHGRDKLMVRITNIQMLYECCKDLPKVPVVKQSLMSNEFDRLPLDPCGDPNFYQYHQQMQHHHQIGTPGDCGYGSEGVSAICPPNWTSFNRFYHFDKNGSDIILHDQEINDPSLRTALIPCGTVSVNRTFVVNPAHRLVFRFSIWKNDLTVVNDTAPVATALKIQQLNDCYCQPNPDHCDCGNQSTVDPDYDRLLGLLHESREIERKQSRAINNLIRKVEELQDKIDASGDSDNPLPPDPDLPVDHDCGCHDQINKKLEEIENEIDDLKEGTCDCDKLVPIDSDTIRELFK